MELEIVKAGETEGAAYIHPETAKTEGIYEGNIILFEDPTTGNFGAAPVYTDKKVEKNKIKIDSTLVESSGLDEGFTVTVKNYTGKLQPLRRIIIGVEPLSGQSPEDVFKQAQERRNELKKLLNKRVIFKKMKLRWKDLESNISIENTDPDLKGQEFAIVNWPEIERAEIVPIGPAMPFNAILLIDVSGSMSTKDMKVVNIAPAREGIVSLLESEQISSFLSKFEEGDEVKRRHGAAFASLLYLAEKVGRGYGEKVAIATYHDEAKIVKFDGNEYYDATTGKIDQVADTILTEVAYKTGGYTNMSDALRKAIGLLKKSFKSGGQNMIIFLTDGFPQGTDTEEAVMSIVERELAQLSNVVLYTVGLGGEVNDRLMENIATVTGGVYFKATDLGKLLNWYSELARTFTKAVHQKEKTPEEEAVAAETSSV
ncbi:MAG: VWA domain-containing protein [Candidatus Jordarchaeum sp.]|uniref:VWA domain-containing protein n=1 Tax=Candidatus Jordarchaeum sp. TaxID=2823881 RepID=UPI00404B0201